MLLERGAARDGEHAVTLRPARGAPAPGAGLLRDAAAPRRVVPPRYAPMHRARRDVPRVFAPPGDAAERVERPRCARALQYRQGARGGASVTRDIEPRRRSGSLRRRSASLLSRCGSLVSLRSAGAGAGRVPQFALEAPAGAGAGAGEAVLYERVYERAYGALSKSSARISAANVADAGAQVDKLYEKAPHARALERKVLNTERYNNGARVRAGGGAERRGAGAESGVGAGLRALLAASGLLYSGSLLAFYFLSLP